MIRNYLKIALRNLRRHIGYTTVNLVGLSVGMACCVLIIVFVNSEYRVNRQFERADTIYRINSVWHEQGDDVRFLSFSPLAGALNDGFVGLKNAFRYTGVDADMMVGDTPFRSPTLIADPALFDVLDFEFIVGSSQNALQSPNSIVLTEPEAIKFFGRTDVLGEIVRVSTWEDGAMRAYQVTGVIAQPDYNSITYIGQNENRSVVSFSNASDFFGDSDFDGDWGIYNTVTYAELEEGAAPESIEAQLPALLENHLPASLQGRVSLVLEPLTQVYLNDFGGGARRLVQLLLIVALLIIGVACFNYINISTALAVARSKEVGLRKVMGASKAQLIRQYVGESLLVCGFGMLLGLVLAQLGISPFNSLVERTLELTYTNAGFWLIISSITLIVGVASGLYPALYLSAVQPIKSLKALARTGKMAMGIRRGLVVAQFAIAFGLFIAALIIHQQASFIAEAETGFDKEHILSVSSLPREWSTEGVEKLDVVKRAMLDIPGIEQVSIAWGPPGPRYTGITWNLAKSGDSVEEGVAVPISQVDADFVATVGLDMVAGSFFDKLHHDSDPVIVLNETAVSALGLESPVGEMVMLDSTAIRVIGVVKDYHAEGLERRIGPIGLVDVRQSGFYRELLIRLPAGDSAALLESIRSTWAEVYPSVTFDYYFVDDQWDQLHKWIWRTQQISSVATLFAIFVACLGLLGIVSISVGQRTQEIGVRKVLGASASGIVRLLSMDFLRLVIIAFLIAVPLVYVFVNRWLEGFANRIAIGVDVVLFAGFVVVLLAGLTVCFQALRAALTNPAEVLRQE